MAKKKRISNTTAILVALGAISGLQITYLLDISDTLPMAIVVLLSVAIGYWCSYLIHQFRKGFRDKN
jgi:hypothetical protein